METGRSYSCESASQTLEWMSAIADFLRPFKPLLDAHVVNFFRDRLWEMVDKEWMDCLCREPAENLLNLPSGLVLEHWPSSLKEFILTLRSLVLPREPDLLNAAMLPDLHVTSIGSVLAQGMNLKKKHEVEILASVVSKIALHIGAETIIDVGAGQGYLAQVLSFEHLLSVYALDASSHHATITAIRAERIKKHYEAKLRKSQDGDKHLNVPQTLTCHVLSSKTLSDLSTTLLHKQTVGHQELTGDVSGTGILEHSNVNLGNPSLLYHRQNAPSSLVLAGLHACGDLSVNMLRTFAECEKVKALVCIGCCYNLLSEEHLQNMDSFCGFPMSNDAKLLALSLGKNARDLACQSAERWKCLTPDAALQNFDLHFFRAAFQMVLDEYYPEVLSSSPSIGRQGKALRRQQVKRIRHPQPNAKESISFPSNSVEEHCKKDASPEAISSWEVEKISNYQDVIPKDDPCITYSNERPDKYALFEDFSKSGLDRLGFTYSQVTDILRIWKETLPFSKFVGPYWSLRAALGPVVETFLLLDRLLFLQEKGNSVEVAMLPLFDPTLSPRNVAIIARKP